MKTFVLSLIACTPFAVAQQFDFAISSGSATIESTTTITTSGYLLGDYDADTNPTGTQTRPGLFGGSGNNPIDTSAVFEVQAGGSPSPAGTFALSINLNAGTVLASSLSLDLLAGGTLPADLSVTLEYATFHTASPTFIYPGGIPITIPLGQLGAVTSATVVATDPGVGTVTPTGDPSVYDIVVAVPVAITFGVELTPLGADPIQQDVGPLPGVFPLAGQLTLVDDTHALLSLSLDPIEDDQTQAIGPLELPGIPLPLPTLGSDTADVVLTLSADSLRIVTSIGVSIEAEGVAIACPADWNSDGLLDFFDVQSFLADFAAGNARADLATDGNFDFFDVQAFLQLFSAGCSNT